jgi:hypothetical protein
MVHSETEEFYLQLCVSYECHAHGITTLTQLNSTIAQPPLNLTQPHHHTKRYHVRTHELVLSFRLAMKSAHKDCKCECTYCGGDGACCAKLDDLTTQSIFDDALCDRGTSPYHRAECVKRTCRTVS